MPCDFSLVFLRHLTYMLRFGVNPGWIYHKSDLWMSQCTSVVEGQVCWLLLEIWIAKFTTISNWCIWCLFHCLVISAIREVLASKIFIFQYNDFVYFFSNKFRRGPCMYKVFLFDDFLMSWHFYTNKEIVVQYFVPFTWR